MILVILILGILMAVGGTILYYKLDDDKDSIGTSLQITGAIIIIISTIASIILFISVIDRVGIEKKRSTCMRRKILRSNSKLQML